MNELLVGLLNAVAWAVGILALFSGVAAVAVWILKPTDVHTVPTCGTTYTLGIQYRNAGVIAWAHRLAFRRVGWCSQLFLDETFCLEQQLGNRVRGDYAAWGNG